MRRVCPLALLLLVAGCKERSTTKIAPSASASTSASVVASTSPSASASQLVIVGRRVDIDVGEHGFTPSEVQLKKGEPTTLVFTRTSNSTCAFEVVFPELKVTKDLPLKRPVPIVVPTDESRTLGFECGMGMYKSKVVIQ